MDRAGRLRIEQAIPLQCLANGDRASRMSRRWRPRQCELVSEGDVRKITTDVMKEEVGAQPCLSRLDVTKA